MTKNKRNEQIIRLPEGDKGRKNNGQKFTNLLKMISLKIQEGQ